MGLEWTDEEDDERWKAEPMPTWQVVVLMTVVTVAIAILTFSSWGATLDG